MKRKNLTPFSFYVSRQFGGTQKNRRKKLNINKKENTKLFFEFMDNKTHGDALHNAVYNAFELIFKIEKEIL